MNIKRLLLILPGVSLPYLTLLGLAIIFLDAPWARFLIETLFDSNALDLAAALVIFALTALILSIVCFFAAMRGNWDAVSLAKTAMIIKLVQIPAYLIIFVLSVIFMITLFTIPFALFLLFTNCLTLAMTSLLNWAAVKLARKQFPELRCNPVLTVMLFIFCADVIASILIFRKIQGCAAK